MVDDQLPHDQEELQSALENLRASVERLLKEKDWLESYCKQMNAALTFDTRQEGSHFHSGAAAEVQHFDNAIIQFPVSGQGRN